MSDELENKSLHAAVLQVDALPCAYHKTQEAHSGCILGFKAPGGEAL